MKEVKNSTHKPGKRGRMKLSPDQSKRAQDQLRALYGTPKTRKPA